MSRQLGINIVARNIALFGAAYWAAERARAGISSLPWTQDAKMSALIAFSFEVWILCLHGIGI